MAAIQASQVREAVGNQEDVFEAVRLGAVNEITEQLEGTGVGDKDSAEDEKQDGDGERTACGGTMPPSYAECSSSFHLLKRPRK